MPNAADSDASVEPGAQSHGCGPIASDLVALIERVQASMRLIEAAIAREAPPGNQEVAANVMILDDVTPRYAKAKAALSSCSAALGVAVHVLLESRTPKRAANKAAESGRRPARRANRADGTVPALHGMPQAPIRAS